jgi:ATP-dependent DNA helicase RecG
MGAKDHTMSAKPKFNPRKLMEMAVEEMRRSVGEPRADRKASPLVGAVLLKPNGVAVAAHRGEFRNGDHAEYTLLERKHRDERLDGSVLFATLEPCAPGARKHPKMACAEHIVAARIAEVWVGIEDPDPMVDRQGIKHLEAHGVKVHLFDLDLQEQIRDANKEFITQALKRASEAKAASPVKTANLSRWDKAVDGVTVADFASDALARYRERTRIPEKTTSIKFLRRLERQALLRAKGKKLVPTGFGFLLFGRAPREVIHHAGLNATIEYPDGSHEIQNFDKPAILIPDLVKTWLHPRLPNVIDRSQMVREERHVMPFELIREAVINALVHRDYDLVGATCHLVITADTITVRSPGAPLAPVTLEQMQSFTAPMYNRNPKLQFAFGGSKLAEGRGLGMRTFGAAAAKHGLPLPKYHFDGLYLNLTLYRHAQAAVETLDADVLKALNEDEKRSWKFLVTKTAVSRKEYAEHMGFDSRKAQRHLKRFVKLGLLRRVGASSSTKYEVRKP